MPPGGDGEARAPARPTCWCRRCRPRPRRTRRAGSRCGCCSCRRRARCRAAGVVVGDALAAAASRGWRSQRRSPVASQYWWTASAMSALTWISSLPVVGERRGLLGAAQRALPREAGTLPAGLPGVGAGRLEPVEAVLQALRGPGPARWPAGSGTSRSRSPRRRGRCSRRRTGRPATGPTACPGGRWRAARRTTRAPAAGAAASPDTTMSERHSLAQAASEAATDPGVAQAALRCGTPPARPGAGRGSPTRSRRRRTW